MNQIKATTKRLLMFFGWLAIKIIRICKRLNFRVSSRVLVLSHLLRSGNPRHPNTKAFIAVLNHFDGEPLRIIETGTSAWGADSTRMWDLYVRYAGGSVKSVDIRPDPGIELQGKLSKKTELFVGDSVEFLRGLDEKHESADLIYLDSFDVDWSNPEPAEIHGEEEFKIAMRLVRVGGIILIDDTPTLSAAERIGIKLVSAKETVLPMSRGKGARAVRFLETNSEFAIFFHDYAVAIKRLK